jgi:hypothetical protein
MLACVNFRTINVKPSEPDIQCRHQTLPSRANQSGP